MSTVSTQVSRFLFGETMDSRAGVRWVQDESGTSLLQITEVLKKKKVRMSETI